ncbi:hypothetical protein GQ53DRAFT_709197 [Thozetella sp. PMI_491]|nr:hypothetical protein GQ53DRAFT_709197 [Thozetella sp. PMI_491]
MLHLNRRHGLSRLIGVSAVFVFFCLAYFYLRDTPLSCEGPASFFDGLAAPAMNKTSSIAKITVAANALNGGIIGRAMQSHATHNNMHGYQHFIAKYTAVSSLIEHDSRNRPKGAWTKPAYILSVMVAELEKEEDERLEWLFWFDADTIVLNPYTPLEIFLPPKSRKDLEDVHLLLSANWDGLNSGAFALRVHPWSVSFLSAVLAYPIYESERQKKDRFRDQSAFQYLLQHAESPMAATPMKGKEHWVEIPMRWFNSLPFNRAFAKGGKWIYSTNMTDDKFDNGTSDVYNDGNPPKVEAWKVMQGDLAVHFAGATAGSKGVRDSWMGRWLDRTEQWLPHWANKTTHYRLREEVDEFWAKASQKMTTARDKAEADKAAAEKAKKETLLTDTSPPPKGAGKDSKAKQKEAEKDKAKEGAKEEVKQEAKKDQNAKDEDAKNDTDAKKVATTTTAATTTSTGTTTTSTGTVTTAKEKGSGTTTTPKAVSTSFHEQGSLEG